MKDGKPRTHKDLDVWRESMELVGLIYQYSTELPKTEQYGLISQIRRASVSIPSNLAEGSGRKTTREFLRYVSIARGSMAELDSQLELCKRLNLSKSQPEDLRKQLSRTGRLLTGLFRSLEAKLKR